MIEKRCMQRFNMQLPILITTSDQMEAKIAKEFVTSDICANGAYVKTPNALSIGTGVLVELPWPPETLCLEVDRKMLISLSGCVVRTDAKGIAIAFNPKYKIIYAQ